MALLPALFLANDYAAGALASPWRTIIQESGVWSMRFLVASLCLSPLAALSGLRGLTEFRRMTGLLGAFYAALHVWAWLRQYGYDWPFLGAELLQRRYLTVGGLAVLLLLPLAATSADIAHRVLGAARWRRVHLLMYPMILAAVLHYEMARSLLRVEVVLDLFLIVAAVIWRAIRRA